MAMKRSQRMAVVLKLANDYENKAVQQLQSCRAAVSGAEDQLQELINYQSEYIESINDKWAAMNAREMINDRAFVENLVQAREVQERRIFQLKNSEAEALNYWRSAHNRRKQIENLIERLKSDESHEADRQLQKLLDELSSQKLIRR